MRTLTARQMLKEVFGKDKNFITPNVIRIGKLTQNYAYELSSGEGLFHDKMWGVTIVFYNPIAGKTVRTQLNGCFFNQNEAERYISDLKKTL